MTTHITDYTILASQLNRLIDRGESVPLEEIDRRVEDGSILDRLRELYDLDTGSHDEEIVDAFQSMANAYDAESDFGVTRNGLALLLGYCITEAQFALV
jgi:hypothetical protein